MDITVYSGEVVALLGPNGAGKTTLLLTAVGALPAQQGEIVLLNAPVRRGMHRQVRRGLAFVPEDRSVIRSLSVRDNLLLGAGGIDTAVDIFPELGKLLERSAGLLSGGEQQMLTLARALAARPRLLVADELSLGLAPLVVERLTDAIRKYVDETGASAFLVEQQARRALDVADRWYLLRQGKIVADSRNPESSRAIEENYLFDADDDLRSNIS
ncbi:ABC transporter ATP-binding protein [Rhodococcus qingshengii]|uniref:ABC transporter ATP-binding protein n=1 Tax=Rhodococcus qingshengii TaxID=334542 RepID=UPI0036DB7A75